MFFYLWDRRIVWTVLCCLFLFIFGLALAFRVFPSPPDDVFFHRLVREDQGWSVELPVTTVILEEYRYPSEEEVLFHLAFQDPVLKFRGVLEKWCLSDLKGFLQSSRERTDLVLSEYRCRETGNYIELFYRQEGREESCIGREFYLSPGEGLHYRWAFFLSPRVYRPAHERIFHRIVNSFRFSQSLLQIPREQGPPTDMGKELPKHGADLLVPVPARML